MNIHICGASKGHWGEIIPAKKIKWISETTGRRVKPPKFLSCECEYHQGKKKKVAVEDMYVQLWELTDEEIDEAIKNYDMMSLEPIKRYICKDCYEKIKKEG
jgi:hypothetical protein